MKHETWQDVLELSVDGWEVTRLEVRVNQFRIASKAATSIHPPLDCNSSTTTSLEHSPHKVGPQDSSNVTAGRLS